MRTVREDILASPTPYPLVADIEDIIANIGSSFFSDLDIETKNGLAPPPNAAQMEQVADALEIDWDRKASLAASIPQKYRSFVIEDIFAAPSRPHTMILMTREASSGKPVKITLQDMWTDCEYRKDGGALIHDRLGTKINIIPWSDQDEIILALSSPYSLVYDPDVLLSTTTVSEAISCLRKAVLTTRMQPSPRDSHMTASLLSGSIVHQVFESCIVQDPEQIGKHLAANIKSAIMQHLLSIYSSRVPEEMIMKQVGDLLCRLPKWCKTFLNPTPKSDALVIDELKSTCSQVSRAICLPQIYGLEESISSNMYGLKGKLDVVCALRFVDASRMHTLVVPFELKTGKVTNSVSHRAQTLLYTLLLSDKHDIPVRFALLYYISTNTLLRVSATDDELQALIMVRNRLASALQGGMTLPKPILNYNTCKQCSQSGNCALLLKLQNEPIPPNPTFKEHLAHLDDWVSDAFFKRWERLISMEEEECRRSQANATMEDCRAIMGAILQSCLPIAQSSGCNRYSALFQLQQNGAREGRGTEMAVGDPVLVYLEGALRHEVAIGFIQKFGESSITISCDRDISSILEMATDHATIDDQLLIVQTAIGRVFRLLKDELFSGLTLARSNLLQLYTRQGSTLRRLIVDLDPPRFNLIQTLPYSDGPPSDGLMALWDPGQRTVIEHLLAAQDYALLLGLPGAGKTTTLVGLIYLLVQGGAKVLVTSYTHSAVDNLLVKLKHVGLSVIRFGNPDKIDSKLEEDIIGHGRFASVSQLGQALSETRVFGSSALGINNPVLSDLNFDVCIVDEASQITLPAVLGALQLAKRFILVGDHFQLPPLVRSKEAAALGLDHSLFRILAEAHPQAVIKLCKQYRMNQDIQLIVNKMIYDDQLCCGTEQIARSSLSLPKYSVFLCAECGVDPFCWLHTALDPDQRVLFLDTDLVPAPEEAVGSSFLNPVEVDLAKLIVDSLLSAGLQPEQVCVLSPYKPQVQRLSQRLAETLVEASTIDRYQGRDKDCVILSFVRSNAIGTVGHLLLDLHRLNVAFTRARRKLLMIGSWRTVMLQDGMRILREILLEKGWHKTLPCGAMQHRPCE